MTVHYISSDRELKDCISAAETTGEIGVDLEFDKNRYRYGFNLCLVQLSAGNDCYLIDPLSKKLEISHLFPVLENPNILKVVFAFGEDLRLLHTLGCYPSNTCDTSMAATLLNYPPQSLTNLLSETLKVETGKSSQQSNWFKRPLSEDQLHYAAQDVIHLSKLKNLLLSQAEERGIRGWIDEENRAVESEDYAGLDDNIIFREKDKKGLNEIEWYLLKTILEYREQLAKQFDKPAYQILDKRLILKFIKEDRQLSSWSQQAGIFGRIRNNSIRDHLVNLVRAGVKEAADLGLSEKRPAEKSLDREEYIKRKIKTARVNLIRNDFFAPIKARIEEDYGRDTANFMLSNRIVTNVITGEATTIRSYKRDVIATYADELGMTVDQYPELEGIFNSEPL